jgi:repressor LexA
MNPVSTRPPEDSSMPAALTKRQEEVLDFLKASRQARGLMPSTREIQEHFGFASQTAAVDVLRALERKGSLKRLPNKARAILLTEQEEPAPSDSAIINLPLFGAVSAGYAEAPFPEHGKFLRVDGSALGLQSGEGCFALRVRGDSMTGAHILDGDYVILDANRLPRHGDIVAALIGGQTTLKRLMIEGHRRWLQAENPRFPDLVAEDQLLVQGVMRGLVRSN